MVGTPLKRLFFGCLVLLLGSSAEAAPLYSATDLGAGYARQLGDGSYVIHDYNTGLETPVRVPIPRSVTPTVPVALWQRLPSEKVWQGISYPVLDDYHMYPIYINSQGTVVGTFPIGPQSNPTSIGRLGYSQVQADGTYGPFQSIAKPDGGVMTHWDTTVMMNASNQIYVSGDSLIYSPNKSYKDGMIIDVNTHSKTPLDDMLAADLLSKYSLGHVYAFADNGSFLVGANIPGVEQPHVLLLSLPVPEPSTFAVVSAGLAMFAAARKLRQALSRRA